MLSSQTAVHASQIVHLGSKVQNLEDANAKLRREAAEEKQSPHNKALAHTNADLRTKLTTAVTMLRQCQQMIGSEPVQAFAADAGQASRLPDVDGFAASCVPLGVADQRDFAQTSCFPDTSFHQSAGLNVGLHSGLQSQPSTPNNLKPNDLKPGAPASSFSFPPPPQSQVSR